MMVCPSLQANAVTVGGPFKLKAPNGQIVTDRTYRGRWLLVYFGYTSCPETCPTTLVVIAKVLAKLGPDANKVQSLFITIDPRRDTPATMEDYARSFDRRIVGLTGTSDEIDAVVQAYGVYVLRHATGPGSLDYDLDHSAYIYLMDPSGVFVRGFDGTWSAERIAAALDLEIKRSRDGEAAKPASLVK